MAKLILVRHGDTALNSRERYWGASDIKLSEDGVRQAEQLRSRLADEKIDIIYSSKLQRASHTAKITSHLDIDFRLPDTYPSICNLCRTSAGK